MKIKIIGTGGAFTRKLYHTLYLLTETYEGVTRNLLLDHGSRNQPLALENAGVKPTEIDDLYFSHKHGDHCGGIEEFGLERFDWGSKAQHWKNRTSKIPTPRLYAHESVMKDFWERRLASGLETMEGFVADINTYFDVIPVKDNTSFFWQGWTVSMVQSIHVVNGSSVMFAFGLFFEKGKDSVFFTTDCQYFQPKQIKIFYKRANLIFAGCETAGCNMKFPEGAKYYTNDKGEDVLWPTDEMESLALLNYEQKTWKRFTGLYSTGVFAEWAGYPSANAHVLEPEIRGNITFTHYADYVANNKDMYGNFCDWDKEAQAAGLMGFAKLGQEWEIGGK